MANIAEYEAEIISERTKAALSAKKARGEKLGSPAPEKGQRLGKATKAAIDEWTIEGAPIVRELQRYGCDTLEKLAGAGSLMTTFRGNTEWALSSLNNLLKRIDALEAADYRNIKKDTQKQGSGMMTDYIRESSWISIHCSCVVTKCHYITVAKQG